MYIHDAHQMRTLDITIDDLMDNPEGAGSVHLVFKYWKVKNGYSSFSNNCFFRKAQLAETIIAI